MLSARTLPAALLLAAASIAPAPAAAQAAARPGMVVSTDWLADHQKDANVVLIHVGSRDSVYRAEHIAGARFLPYMAMVQDSAGVVSELPSADSLRTVFESLGVSDDSHVILTGQNLVATRAYFTLDYIGHPRVSILDGGLSKWKKEGRPVTIGEETGVRAQSRGRLSARPGNDGIVATTEWVKSKVGARGVAFFDTRTAEEYDGAGHNVTGHIEGARRVEWRDYFADPYEFVLKDRATLARLFAERAQSPADTVIAYCAVGYRASGTYFVAKMLGVPVKLYDGSYDAWSKAGLPTTRVATPLLAPRGT